MSESFEWLRPAWLAALPLALGVGWAWWRVRAGDGPWRALVDPGLLVALRERAPARGARLAPGLTAALLALACVALAGPSWRAQPAALYHDAGARVVVIDLSPSMDAIDVAPSRIARARAALPALLAETPGALLGLVVFGADAFAVAPFTTDAALLVHLAAGLATGTLPRAGSRTDLGLEHARALLQKAGAAGGDVILVGDSAGDARALEAARALARDGFPVSVLAVGTSHGGPMRLAGGALARGAAGEVLVARPDFAALERLAQAGGGRFRLLPTAGDTPSFPREAQARAGARASQPGGARVRQDDGAWLALLALPLAAALFRRGWLAGFAACALGAGLWAPPAQAFEWQDLWRRADQQAAAAFARPGASSDARLIDRLGEDSPWRAPMLYRAGRYAEAAARFSSEDTAAAHYNRGNALALDGRLEEALAAYDAALERRPSMRDARHNRALVAEALARRRALGEFGEDPLSPGEPRDSVRRAPGPGAGEAARGSQGQARGRDGAWDEPGLRARAQARGKSAAAQSRRDGAAQEPEQGSGDAELRRLEGLLGQVPDDSASMLANRFARLWWLRGSPRHDPGAPW